MTHEEKLNRLCQSGEQMRKLQNMYFNEKSDKYKADWLRRAKVAEREFDQLLREVRQRSFFTP